MKNTELIRELLTTVKVIAVVGFSNNRARPSNRVGRYMHGNGYKVYGINPGLENKEVDNLLSKF